jgi:hypothetical protein
MIHKFHMPIQRNILLWLLMPSYSGKNILRKTWSAQHQVQENVLVAWTQFWTISPQ